MTAAPDGGAGLGLIWAQTLARPGRPSLIGRGGTLPWHLPEDLAHFRAITAGHPVIMGRATWDSLPVRFRPLPGRRNLVITRQPQWTAVGAQVVHDRPQALHLVEGARAWVIGGAQIYRLFLDVADRAEVTEVDLDPGPPEIGDALAPDLDGSWHRRDGGDWVTAQNGLRYRFVSYARAQADALRA